MALLARRRCKAPSGAAFRPAYLRGEAIEQGAVRMDATRKQYMGLRCPSQVFDPVAPSLSHVRSAVA